MPAASNALSTDLMATLGDESTCDFKLICNGGEVKVHKFILSMRSTVFKTMLDTNTWQEVETGEMRIENYSIEVVRAMVKFIYTARIEKTFTEFQELLKIGHQYELHSLVTECGKKLVSHICVENAVQLGILAEQYGATVLLRAAAETVAKNLSVLQDDWQEQVHNSPGFLTTLVASFKQVKAEEQRLGIEQGLRSEQKFKLFRLDPKTTKGVAECYYGNIATCDINFQTSESTVLEKIEVMNTNMVDMEEMEELMSCTVEIMAGGHTVLSERHTVKCYTEDCKTSQLCLATPVNIGRGVEYSLRITAHKKEWEVIGSGWMYESEEAGLAQCGDRRLLVTFSGECTNEQISVNDVVVSLGFRMQD